MKEKQTFLLVSDIDVENTCFLMLNSKKKILIVLYCIVLYLFAIYYKNAITYIQVCYIQVC